MTSDQPSARPRPVLAAAQYDERRITFARAQRERVIASLLLCPAHDPPS